MTHQIKLKNVSATLLVNALNTPGWIQTNTELITASSLVVEKFEKLEPKFIEGTPGVVDRAWGDAEQEWTFTERERETVKSCLLRNAKNIQPGRAALGLRPKFGLGEA